MTERYVFADEAGNFDFSNGRGASRYFVLCTVMAEHCAAGDALLALRRDLGWRGIHLDRVFHASEDSQAIRAEVFALLGAHDFWIDATILEKRKAQPHLRDEASLYKMAWYLHFKYLAKQMRPSDRLFVAASSLGTKRARGRCTRRSTMWSTGFRRAAHIELPSGPRRVTRACRSPTTARGRYSASGSEGTIARMPWYSRKSAASSMSGSGAASSTTRGSAPAKLVRLCG